MYTATGRLDVPARADALLRQYSPLVRRLAHQMIAKLPANVELDDLIQVGMIGLTDALARFDAAQGVQFETFATQRIRGAMLDELRGTDWMSRGDRASSADRGRRAQAEQKLGRAPDRERDRAGDGPQPGRVPGHADQGARHAAGVPGGHRRPSEGDDDYLDRHVVDDADNPLALLQDRRMRSALVEAIKRCPSASST
jgi:RNA polymerase sigma factor for flagellar operon FliA